MLSYYSQSLKALIETRNPRPERVFLVGTEFKSRNGADTRDSLAELGELAATAGGEIIGDGRQKMDAPTPATFIGKGKAEEFAAFCRRNDVDTVIFDDELSPAQSRTLEKIFNCKILDRTSLILDIFAQRARTREGKLQIELAQLQHLLPRLTRFWGHLSRQAGGIGMRGGEGESQLESDRRRVQERIDKISRDRGSAFNQIVDSLSEFAPRRGGVAGFHARDARPFLKISAISSSVANRLARASAIPWPTAARSSSVRRYTPVRRASISRA